MSSDIVLDKDDDERGEASGSDLENDNFDEDAQFEAEGKILTTVELAKISKILIALVTYNTPVLLHIVN